MFGLSSLEDLPETELSPTAIDEKSLAVEEVGFVGGTAEESDLTENTATDGE